MAKLDLNHDALKASCIDNLKIIIENYDNVIRQFDNLNVPYDFFKKYKIFAAKNDLANERRKVCRIYDLIVESNNDFIRTTNDLLKSSIKLPISKYSKRG